jgi:quinol monooxygenase YgiN
MYTLAVKVKVRLQKQVEFLQALRSLQSEEQGEEVSTNLRFYEDEEDRMAYRLVDRWDTEEDLARYLSGEKFRVLLGALEILCEESEIKYMQIPEHLIHNLEPVLRSDNKRPKPLSMARS